MVLMSQRAAILSTLPTFSAESKRAGGRRTQALRQRPPAVLDAEVDTRRQPRTDRSS